MSTIEELSIQGIRSFGTNAEDMQAIRFSSPVSLILGDNGCGKTTIIECLKYALTGDFPPGSDRGKSFVHDPKIFKLCDARSQIKLRVKNLSGERISVCRSMKISFRAGKSTLGTIDATVNYLDESISRRCADVDATMCQFMGVSKAIINNVLFCHQEDSNWPLDEPKKLKEKFDAIFDITEYNKAIDKIIAMRKDEAEKLKLKEADLRHLSHLKQEMENKTVALQRAQEKCDGVKEEVAKFDAQMKPIEDRLAEIRKVEMEVGKYQARKVELETQQNNCREQIEGLKSKLKTPFAGTLEELDRELATFAEKMSAKQLERHNLKEELTKCQTAHQRLQSQHAEQDKELHTCTQQRKQETSCKSQRAQSIHTLCQKLQVAQNRSVDEFQDNVEDVLTQLEAALQQEQQEIATLAATHDREDQQRQTDIDALRVNMTKLQESLSSLRKQRQQNERDHKELNLKITNIEATAQEMTRINQKLERVDEMHRSLTSKFNQDGLRQEISTAKEKVTDLQTQFRQVDERLTFLNSIAKSMAEITLKETELEKKERDVRRVKSKHTDNFQKLFKAGVTENYRRKLQDTYEQLRREIKQLNEQTNALKLKEQSCDIKRKNLKEEITRMEKELEDGRDRIYEECHATAYVDLVAKCNATVNKYQLELGALKSAESMYKKYISRIEAEPCCPLCDNPMNANDASDLTIKLSDEIHRLPENILQAEKQLKTEQRKYTNLLQLKPDIDRVARLEVDIPKRKEELKQLQTELPDCANEVESLQMVLVEPMMKLELANTMFGDMSLLDEAIKETGRLSNDIQAIKRKLPAGTESDRSVEELQEQKNGISEQLERERQFVEQKQKDYEKTMEGLNALRETKNTLKDQQIKLQEGLQSLPQLKERQLELSTLVDTLVFEIDENQSKVEPLESELNTAIGEKTRLKEYNRKKLSQLQQKLEMNKNVDRDIKRLNLEVVKFNRLNLTEKVANLQTKLQRIKEDIDGHSVRITKANRDWETVKTECLNQETLERDLKDNREMKLLQQRELELKEQREQLNKELGDLDFRRVAREKESLVKRRDDATERKGELLGQIGEIRGQINKLYAEIERPEFKDALHNYRAANYEVHVSKRLITAFGQYRVALEWSLIKFHAEKMETINRLIREYWRLIYQGNDIDYIQVQTDELQTNASADRRRCYNYRVIQSKNNSEIEMRGRCSAGQRVLACLIIRMALAETFGSSCGVFALDEPTTNLDRKNIVSLCDALNRVVEQRQAQSNFMLIIITHDEEFISTLGKISSYHRVLRNRECKSEIKRVSVED